LWLTWHLIAYHQGLSFKVRQSYLVSTPKDKFVVSLCVLLYLIYPTLCKQAFGLFNCIEVEQDRYFLLADLEEECWVGRHVTMVVVVGMFQLLVYVLGLPVIGLYFMYRNRDDLTRHVVTTRYGLFLGGYRTERYYWEVMLVMRKVTVIALSVFGTTVGIRVQVHITSLFILLFMIAQAVWKPFGPPGVSSKSGGGSRVKRPSLTLFHVPAARYNVLQRIELLSMLVIWLTLWCGLLMFYIDDIEAGPHIFLTLLTFSMNVCLMLWICWKMAVEVVYEFQKQSEEKRKRKKKHGGGVEEGNEDDGGKCVKCLACCTKRTQRWCPCLKEDSRLRRTLSGRVSKVLHRRGESQVIEMPQMSDLTQDGEIPLPLSSRLDRGEDSDAGRSNVTN